MLTTLRKRVRIIMIIVAVAFVGGFLLGELWSLLRTRQLQGGRRNPDVVGVVDDRRVTVQEYRDVVAYTTEKYREETGLRDLAANDYEEIENRAWSDIVERITWGKLFQKSKVAVSNDEIVEIMRANPPQEILDNPEMLDEEGNFDREKYQQVMDNPENQAYFSRYFRQLVEMLPKEKFRIHVVNSYRVTDAEAVEDAQAAQSHFRVTWLFFGPGLAGNLPPATDEELRAYYDGHIDEYTTKEIRRVDYVRFPINVTAEDSAEARDLITRAHDQLGEGEGFNITMLDFSDFVADTMPALAGRDRLDPVTDSVVGTMEAGSYSEPFLNQYGWQIVMLDSLTDDSVKMRRVIVRVKLGSDAIAVARDDARDFLERTKGAAFDTVAADMGLPVTPLRPLVDGKGDFSPLQLLNDGALERWAISAKAGDIIQYPLRSQGGLYLFRVAGVEPPKPTGFEEAKRRVEWRLKQERQKEIWRARLDEAVAAIRGGQTLEAYAAANEGVELHTEEYTGLQQAEQRRGPEFAGALFALKPGETFGPVVTDWGGQIIRCDERSDPPDAIITGVAEQRHQRIVQQTLSDLLTRPEVKDYRDELFN